MDNPRMLMLATKIRLNPELTMWQLEEALLAVLRLASESSTLSREEVLQAIEREL